LDHFSIFATNVREMKRRALTLLPAVILGISSCSTSRMAVEVTPENHHAREYIDKYSSIAVSEMRRTGVPASIKLAQGMIESDYGRSRLAKVANNHFGIKCHSSWRGPVIYHDDDVRDECFRKYSNPEESFRDHSDFLVSGSRYRNLFSLSPTDYKGWARGLKSAGYATNPAYADMLIRKIEQNGLGVFDSGSGSGSGSDTGRGAVIKSLSDRGSRYPAAVAGRVIIRNRVECIIVNEYDTFESVSRGFSLLSWELERYNELPAGELLRAGNTLYLQPKRKKAEYGIRYHIVREGETMHQVSQLYAVKLQSLYKLNFMEPGSEPEAGRMINLR